MVQSKDSQVAEILHQFSEGKIDRRSAVERLNVRDYSELLMMLGEAGLPLPTLSQTLIEHQAETFSQVWSSA